MAESRESGEEFEARMRALAGEWRRRLRSPALQQQLRAGKLRLSPLVEELLAAFPPTPTESGGN